MPWSMRDQRECRVACDGIAEDAHQNADRIGRVFDAQETLLLPTRVLVALFIPLLAPICLRESFYPPLLAASASRRYHLH